ncbi:hypothetical protein [Thalassotalea agarivorans]|uniref:Uncharacterized protein n=1 Tax=Thalassotalea agarivorans TaxID=349064 RepID=A0A1H9ZFQ6_THASX|nr:hypothetical protein [Thalassotalea agarivorans]SES80337.1 hypothetical protein SAMN05660429_00430 [Thalassotalea agarivorans]
MNIESNSQWKANQVNRIKSLAIWTFAWVFSLAIATFGPIFIWQHVALTLLAVMVNVGFGVAMILANKRHLESLDEMQRKINMDAMAITLGAGLVLGLAYSVLDTTNVIASDAEISVLVMIMSLTYLTSMLIGKARLS